MTSPNWDSPVTRFPWGKLSEGKSHHLAHHCADVAACFEALSELHVIRKRLETAAGRPLDSTDIARLALFAFLHDLGKLHPEFQAKAFIDRRNQVRGHSAEGLAALLMQINDADIGQEMREALNLNRIAKWSDEATLCSLSLAVFAHHGRPVTVSDINMNAWSKVLPGLEDYSVSNGVHEIGSLLPIWFPNAFSPAAFTLPSAPAFQHLFCGLVALADWIGSDQKHFKLSTQLDDTYMQNARNIAKDAIIKIGLDPTAFRERIVGTEFTNIAPGLKPRNAQAMIGGWPLDDRLIILEAETGSGKTEAALWRFARLFEAGEVDSLYFAVPTRAAAKQLHGRVHAAMKNLFREKVPQTVLAIPGYLQAGDFKGQALPDFRVLWDDKNEDQDHAMRWAAESPRRFLAATVAVGTVDQAMLAGLMVKHAHLRGAALSRSLLVIDEVHASDAYMTEVQKNLLDIQLDRGGHAMLMSATLGSVARSNWLGSTEQHDLKEAREVVYPAIWGKTVGLKPIDSDGRRKTVRMTCLNDWSAIKCANLAIQAARKNARVLVIRNTVQTAIETFDAVQQEGASNLLLQIAGRPALHHSRFAVEDRRRLDDAAEAALSPNMARRPKNGVIVIGTQTLEQSLDICADYLISDLCPADVLLQRIGRLHRHKLDRPLGYEAPECVVLSPANGLDKFASGKLFENGLGRMRNGGGVYLNLHANELTRRMVIEHGEWIIPDMNRHLVEGATHQNVVDCLNNELGKDWHDFWNSYGGTELADRQGGGRVTLDASLSFFRDDGFAFLFPDSETEIRTRLGAEGVRIKFVEGTIGPFGQLVSEIVCPAHWNIQLPEAPTELRTGSNGTLTFELLAANGKAFSLWYGTKGLIH